MIASPASENEYGESTFADCHKVGIAGRFNLVQWNILEVANMCTVLGCSVDVSMYIRA